MGKSSLSIDCTISSVSRFEKESKRFNDANFNRLFYEQMSSVAKKLNAFSLRQGKIFKELELEDLIILVKENNDN